MKKNDNNTTLKHYVGYFKKDIYLAIALTVLFTPLINNFIRPLRIIEFLLFIGALGGVLSYQFFLKDLGKHFLSFSRKYQLTYFFVLLFFVITHMKNDFFELWVLLMLFSILTPVLTYILLLNISDRIRREGKIRLLDYGWHILAILSLYILHFLLSSFIAD